MVDIVNNILKNGRTTEQVVNETLKVGQDLKKVKLTK